MHLDRQYGVAAPAAVLIDSVYLCLRAFMPSGKLRSSQKPRLVFTAYLHLEVGSS